MMVTCRLVWCPDTPHKVQEFIQSEFSPMIRKCWERELKATGEVPSLDVPSFLAAWEQRGINLIMATEGARPVGILIAYVFRPLMLPKAVMHVERWYGERIDIEEELFAFLLSTVPITGVNIVYAADCPWMKLPESLKTVVKLSYEMKRLEV